MVLRRQKATITLETNCQENIFFQLMYNEINKAGDYPPALLDSFHWTESLNNIILSYLMSRNINRHIFFSSNNYSWDPIKFEYFSFKNHLSQL